MTPKQSPNYTPGITTPNHLVPTSSRPRPAAGDDLPNRPRPSSPTPLGDEVELRRPGTTTETTPDLVPGTRSEHPIHNPGTTWLITTYTKPAWTAALAVLDDNEWHPTEYVYDAMLAAGLADRTIANHLNSASRRRWITRRNKRIRLRERHLLEAALDLMDGRG